MSPATVVAAAAEVAEWRRAKLVNLQGRLMVSLV
jgi:hypothetical protein